MDKRSMASVGIPAVATGARMLWNKLSGGTTVPKKTPLPRRVKKPKRMKRKYSSKVPRNIKALERRIEELDRKASADIGTHLERRREFGRFTALDGIKGYGYMTFNSATYNEATLANLRYYNPSDPANLVTASGATGTFQRDFYFKRVSARLSIRAAYQMDAFVTVYICEPKVDTNISVTTAYTNGLTDVGNPTAASPLVHVFDSPQFNDLWKITKTYKRCLKPGEEFSIYWKTNESYVYDPSLYDSHGLDYQPKFKPAVAWVRVDGPLGHDTAQTEINQIKTAVDTICTTTTEIQYAAGIELRTVYIDDNATATFTNSGVSTNAPISDNQAYSAA